MLPAHLADRLLKQRRDADSAEFARQLPLHAPMDADDPRWMTEPDGSEQPGRREPDWATDY
ncbi:hypothetical protein [Azospirillum sp. TSH64]|uniref:hypothetical protein n=1 Tax=Azospirillum sp. TSH64 TaxID=652740 RepID=UPI000D60A2F4|nr:hypothetical protein [Azospirillum sp. TSH64]PWC77211.1 hypothetical protein TSH64_22360 [Azospirillum sp. TSH64]